MSLTYFNTIASTTQIINRDYINSLMETTNLQNTNQGAPNTGIRLTLGLMASTTSQLSLINTDMLKIPLQEINFKQ